MLALTAAAALSACSDAEPAATGSPAATPSATTAASAPAAADGDCKQAQGALLVASTRMAGVSLNIGMAKPASPREGLDKAAGVLDLALGVLDEALPKMTGGAVKDLVQSVRTDAAAFQQNLKSSTDPDEAAKAAEAFAAAVDAKTQQLATLCS
ncbi:hypothetical protein [Catellatospora sp. IY07-71]|uniref:hypothetical protein n=1 Tax=Catellatospora sp. IY07-71 TaxID=2728827 RepID=UPI001BB45E84|nr:hypothetical protein [Catellatospora sp. IY07-71]